MAKSDRAGMPKHRKRPLLLLLRESGDALEAASPPFDAAAAAAQLCEAARAHGLLRPADIPEDDLAVTDSRLEEEAPPFDVEAGATRLREAARARRLLPSDPDIWPNSYRPPDPGSRRVPFGPDIAWPYGFRQLDAESREVLESAYGTGPTYQQPATDDPGYGDPGYGDPGYGDPGYEDPGYEDPGYSNPVPDGSRSADPRLEGMTYEYEIRYDPAPEGAGESGYDEPLDEESRYRKLPRSVPAYPQRSGGPKGPSSPPRPDEPQVPAHGRQHGDSR